MGVTGPSHFRFSLRTDCSERKKILNEKSNVPTIKSIETHRLSSTGKTATSNKARPWYIIYRTPTSKECKADSGSNFLRR